MSDIVDIPALAARLHAGQVDKAGALYVTHLARVAAILLRRWPDASADEIAAAWLHDSLEDTDASEDSLLAAGVSAETIRIVRAVTRPEGSDYLAWIAALAASGDVSVLRVKLADNEDNRDPVRVAALPGAAERVATRYEPARQLLEAGLARTIGQTLHFEGLAGKLSISIEPRGIAYEDTALRIDRDGVPSTWYVEVETTDANGATQLQGLIREGKGYWFVLTLGTPAILTLSGEKDTPAQTFLASGAKVEAERHGATK